MKLSTLNSQLSTFLRSALTRREAPDDEELLRHLAQVPENDHCLAAVRELLSQRMLESAMTAGAIQSDDKLKLRACERMEFARLFLAELEAKLAEAKEWRKRQEAA